MEKLSKAPPRKHVEHPEKRPTILFEKGCKRISVNPRRWYLNPNPVHGKHDQGEQNPLT